MAEIKKDGNAEFLETMRHSCAHVMADAVKKLMDSPIERVFAANTINIPKEK